MFENFTYSGSDDNIMLSYSGSIKNSKFFEKVFEIFATMRLFRPTFPTKRGLQSGSSLVKHHYADPLTLCLFAHPKPKEFMLIALMSN